MRTRGLSASAFGDLDHLPARQGQILDQRTRVNVRGAGAGKRLFGHAVLGRTIDHAEPLRRPGNGDVVGNRQVRDQRQFLDVQTIQAWFAAAR